MECFKCKAKVSNVDKYCPRCGTVFDNGDVETFGGTLDNQLLNIYLNKKRFNANFSIGYLIFNFLYALYKKMYLDAAFAVLADSFLVIMISNWKIYLIDSMGFNALLIIFMIMLGVVVNVYYILHFDEIYITRTKAYINKLIRDYGSDNRDFLRNKCEKDSKGNWLGSLLIVIGIIMFFLALIFKNIAFLSFCGII